MEQTILVTGSNSGFGRLIVETLARQAHCVLFTAFDDLMNTAFCS
jgi:NAD(P)-dependent dehydrogenase (short-subunit alcohol dehydrogenase family)